MANWDLGNILYYDTNGAVKSSRGVQIQKIALWGVGRTSELTFAVNGTTTLRLAVVTNGTSQTSNWQSESFNPPMLMSNCSIQSVTAGSGYIYLA